MKDIEKIIEYILYKRDRNPKKNWGHIRGWTTIFSYCRLFIDTKHFQEYENILAQDIEPTNIQISMLQDWRNGKFERKFLEKYNYEDDYLYNFIYAISPNESHDKDYYFRFSEDIDDTGLEYLLISYKQNPKYLFTLIALASYYFHNGGLEKAYNFYILALKLDPKNPYVLAKYSLLCFSIGTEKSIANGEKTMKRVQSLLPDSPWANAWYGEVLNKVGKYTEALTFFVIYETLTEGKYRTFEPFLRKAESYIGLGDFVRARGELDKEKKYYFGEGYRFVYDDFDTRLRQLGY